MGKVIIFIRWVLTFLLIWGVYTETGIFIAIALTLSVVAIEIICRGIKLIREILQASKEAK